MQIINPATNEMIQEIVADDSQSVVSKYKNATEGFQDFSQTSFESRKKAIALFSKKLAENVEKLAKIQTSETGKPISQARSEILAVRTRIDYFLDHTQKLLEPSREKAQENMEEWIEWQPLGVVLNISAWNYPWFTGANVYIPALLTGNAVLYKPSEYAALTGLEVQRLLIESGIPKNAFQTVIGDGEIGAQLVSLDVDGIFFTGSYQTGIKIAKQAAHKLIPVQMELGGKDPAYICEDVMIKQTAESVADGAFYNAGQSCCSVERIYVHENIYEEFIKEFLATVRAFKMGNPEEESTYIGPLVNHMAVQKVLAQVQDAVAKGAKILAGKTQASTKGNYLEPLVLVDVDHTMSLMKEESFGPIIGIQKVKNDEEAISLMNDTDYGLTAAVFCKNQKRAKDILNQTKSGTAYWNCSDRVSPWLPWSGRGHSGIGATLSRSGIRAFLQPRAWHLKSV